RDLSAGLYRLYFGGRWRSNIGDGDHILQVTSTTGARGSWSVADHPEFLQGQEEGYIGEWFSNNYLTPCASLLRNQRGKVERPMSPCDIHPGRDGVAQDLPQQAAAQVPQVLRPGPLRLESPRQLAVDRLDQPVQPAQRTRSLRLRVML